MSVALQLYQQLRDAPDENTRSKAIATAFEQLEERYPNLKDVATQSNLRETELRLQKEIKEVEAKLLKEIKEVDVRLQKEIALVQSNLRETELRLQKEIKETELRLQKDIKDVDLRVKQVEIKLAEVEVRLTLAINRQTYWIIGSVGTVIGFIRLLDWLLAIVPK